MTKLAALFDQSEDNDDDAREPAYLEILGRKDNPSDLYAQWSRFAALLTHTNNHIRSIGGKLFSHIAGIDPDGRIWELWELWKTVAADKMFIAARHTIQASPQFALASEERQKRLLSYYQDRSRSYVAEKNTTLIRYDLPVCLREVYGLRPDPADAALARALIAEEADPKYQAWYKTAWRKVPELAVGGQSVIIQRYRR